MSTRELPNPADVAAVRRWLAERTPDLDMVRTWAARVLARVESVSVVPDLGSPAWTALADTDARKLAAALRPALAQLVERTPSAIATRLRTELDDHATTWRRSLAELHADMSGAWHELGYGVGPSYAEIVRRRNTYPCGQCHRPLRIGITVCAECGWCELAPAQLRARAREAWAHYACRRSDTATLDEQGAA